MEDIKRHIESATEEAARIDLEIQTIENSIRDTRDKLHAINLEMKAIFEDPTKEERINELTNEHMRLSSLTHAPLERLTTLKIRRKELAPKVLKQ